MADCMATESSDDRDASAGETQRVFVLAPLGRDAAVIGRVLGTAGIACQSVRSISEFTAALRNAECGIGDAAIVTEEALTPDGVAALAAMLSEQPPWSDLPLLLLLAEGGRSASATTRHLATLRAAGNVAVLVRPVPAVVLLTTMQSFLRARRRQYEVRDLLAREQAARREAENANRLKDEFLTNVSHELGTPLSAILMWTRLSADGRLDAKESVEALQKIGRSATAQLRLVDDLLDASRMLSGKLRIHACECQLEPAVRAAVEVIRPALEPRGLRLEVALDPVAGPVLADAGRIQQVVSNLLGNAVKFTPPGGSIRITLERVGDDVQIRVRDTGQGISREFLPHVFERFRQADSAQSRLHGGLGLGLAICHQLVELHGGTLTAESDGAGKGAVFTVRFPSVD